MKVPQNVIAAVRGNDDFLLASHIGPEGDALGSQIALAMALEQAGKKTTLYNRDGVPYFYEFLPGHEMLRTSLEGLDTESMTLLLLDCNTPERAALDGVNFKFAVVIDHHQTGNDFGDARWVEPRAPATGLMVFELIRALGAEMTREMATNLYAAIAIDTGTFRYSNTSPESLRAAADLVEAGAEPSLVAQMLYESWSTNRFKLLCMAMGGVEINDGVAFTTVTQEMFRKTGTTSEDTEEFANQARTMGDIKVSVFVRELPDGSWKVSLRSKGAYNVAKVAEGFGGGGHINAAGCRIEGDLASVKKKLIEAIREIL